MNIFKNLKKLTGSNLVLVVGAIALLIAICNYSSNKGVLLDGLENEGGSMLPSNIVNPPQSPGVDNTNSDCCVSTGGSPQPSQANLGNNEVYSSARNYQTSGGGLPPSCSSPQVTDPKELLPRDSNSGWGELQAGDGLNNAQFLQSGYHIGIDTVGQSLRNPNLQLRSEPPNPQLNIGPWNNTTMGPDFNRRPLEIGCGMAA